jgi:glycosyltransferase involved in cell wall biosynthesis
MVPLVGFKSTTVSYERGERFAGESKYPLKKMVSFAFEGITSMSVKPIRMIATLGGAVFAVSLVILLYSLIRHFTGHTVEGWTFLAVSIWALGGIQLLAIGVIGEYIGKIYLETKHRPKYVISQYLKDETCHE